MIDTKEDVSLFEKTDTFVCVFDWNGERAFSELRKSFEKRFSDKNCYYVGLDRSTEKKEEDYNLKNLLVLSKKSLNFFGNWKQAEKLDELRSTKEKVVVYFCTDHSKLVNKLSNSINHAVSVGFENEKMINFDLAFRIDMRNEEELLDQTLKYLKRL